MHMLIAIPHPSIAVSPVLQVGFIGGKSGLPKVTE